MSTPGRGRGELEREVLAAVAAAPSPLSAGEVLAELGGALAYTTVMTTLSRLQAKGVLTRQLLGRAYVYSVAGGAVDLDSCLAAHRMRRALESRPDRAGVLARFVAELSAEDERVLLSLLEQAPPLRSPEQQPG